MKKNIYIGYMMLAVGMLSVTSCTDYSDYNDVPQDRLSSANQTLWENIAKNSNLTDFKSLLEKSGFNAELNNSHTYTVWAPEDGSFNVADYDKLSQEELLNQFVKNHVAEYNYAASGELNKRIHTLNEKSYVFEGNGTYSFDGLEVLKSNIPGNNGVLHTIKGAAKFYPNLYEYIQKGERVDSILRAYFLKYETTRLDENKSVKGPVDENGYQTYIDSVTVTTNSLTNRLNARIAKEDSSYTMLIPTEKAYTDMYEKVKKLNRYIGTTQAQTDFSSATSFTTKSTTIDAAYMTDSLSSFAVVENLIFNNHLSYNRWLEGKSEDKDTLVTTLYESLSNPQEILSYQKGDKVMLSNGQAFVMDTLAFRPWETYNPMIIVNPAGNVRPDNPKQLFNFNFSSTAKKQSLPDSLIAPVLGNLDFLDKETVDQISSFNYMWYEPNGDYGKPDIFVTLPNVLSGTYKFYVVFMPSAMEELGKDTLPNLLNFQLNYCTEKNTIAKYNFTSSGKENPTVHNKTTAFTNDPTKTDVICIGKFKFPVAYKGLGDEYRPNLRIYSPINPYPTKPGQPAADLLLYTRNVRIAFIVLVPEEYDNYKSQNNN